MKDIVIEQLLKDPFSVEFLREFGLENGSEAAKASVLERTAEILMKRLILEILKKLPKKEHATFDKMVENGAPTDAWYEFLRPYVGDVEEFVNGVFKAELDSILTAKE